MIVLMVAGLVACTRGPVVLPVPVPSPSRPVPIDIVLFLRNDVTGPQKQEVEARLRALPSVTRFTFETREQAYERFKETFKDAPELVASVRPEDLPEAFKVTLADRTAAEPVLAELRQLPGVAEVTAPPTVTPSTTR
ncbi:permease-like cell division protein FtsX [Micromonospora pisi]|uniref:permease-like cell division protein FtsX n=1 Tax=Micromonospora pisi TaxID=589240 RepID=UPI0011C349EA|nr:permease-like cell division protein FtsX [Micromonospora pisi]